MEHQTTEFMTRYEYTNIIIARATELARGSEPHSSIVDGLGDCIDVIEIARRELSARVLDMYVKRSLPNGEEDIWPVKEMSIRDY